MEPDISQYNGVLNMTTIQTGDPEIGDVILLQEISDTSLNAVENVQSESFEQVDEAALNKTVSDQSSSDRQKDISDAGEEGETTKSDISVTEPEKLKISPIYKITHNKDILKKIQAKTFVPEVNILKQNEDVETKPEFTDPQNVKVEVAVQKVEEAYERLSRRRCRKLQNFLPIPDRVVPPRALAVLPPALQCRRDVITPHHRALPPKVLFGPVEGIRRKVMAENAPDLIAEAVKQNKPIFLIKNEDSSVIHIDVSDHDKSNWIGLLQMGDESSANVWLQQRNNRLYAATTHSIQSRVPLKLGYSKTYVDDHRIPHGPPVLDFVTALPKSAKEWWCNECSKVMPSLSQLQIHLDKYHQDDFVKRRGRYRCRYCTRRFTRLYCLKRHVASYCLKRKTEPDEHTMQVEEFKENTDLNASAIIQEESARLPSDESLQNFTNLLDISTSLFDTDRMSNLDISGSKCDNDFIKLAEDIRLTNDFDWMDLPVTDRVEDVKKSTNPQPPRASSPISCPYCNLHMTRSKLKQHSRVCPSRRFECMCGITFKCKEKLALHVHTTHPVTSGQDSLQTDNSVKENETGVSRAKKKKIEFKCEHCNMEFKRRGMYINHLTKVHELPSAHVPLVVQDKRYPCPACPKLYRAASKRDQHVSCHHPGVQYDRKSSITGGTRRIQPAACQLCPRQYATRAKLLQHTKSKHHKHYQAIQLSNATTKQAKQHTKRKKTIKKQETGT